MKSWQTNISCVFEYKSKSKYVALNQIQNTFWDLVTFNWGHFEVIQVLICPSIKNLPHLMAHPPWSNFARSKQKKFLRRHNEVKSFEFSPEIVKNDQNILWKQFCLCQNQATFNHQIYRYFPWLAISSIFITNNFTIKNTIINIFSH